MYSLRNNKLLVRGLIIIFVFTISSCSLFNDPEITITDGFNLIIGDEVVLGKNEIDAYDFSAHIIYLRSSVRLDPVALENKPFYVVCDRDTVYEGIAFTNSDSIDSDNVFLSFEDKSNGIIYLSKLNWLLEVYSGINDPRNDKRIVDALKEDQLYHQGLSCSIDTVIRHSSNNVEVNLLLENNDSFNFYYFDPDKMTSLNYYTLNSGGLSFYDTDFVNTIYRIYYEQSYPEDLNCCSLSNYVSLIKSGESKILKIIYDDYPLIEAGEYYAVFPYTGRLFSYLNESELENGKMWRGYYSIVKKVVFE